MTINESKIHIIENGIDEWWFEPTKEKNTLGEYVLTVGRVERSKGQLETAKACKELGINYYCVGEIIEPRYAQAIKDAGGVLLGPKTKEELKPLYKHAKVFVLASKHEIFPLTIMEAGSQGTNVVLTSGSEWKDIPGVELCEFGDVESVKKAIETSLKKKRNTEFIKKLKKTTWRDVALQVLEVYKKIL